MAPLRHIRRLHIRVLSSFAAALTSIGALSSWDPNRPPLFEVRHAGHIRLNKKPRSMFWSVHERWVKALELASSATRSPSLALVREVTTRPSSAKERRLRHEPS